MSNESSIVQQTLRGFEESFETPRDKPVDMVRAERYCGILAPTRVQALLWAVRDGSCHQVIQALQRRPTSLEEDSQIARELEIRGGLQQGDPEFPRIQAVLRDAGVIE